MIAKSASITADAPVARSTLPSNNLIAARRSFALKIFFFRSGERGHMPRGECRRRASENQRACSPT
jgi:hypothetical protein